MNASIAVELRRAFVYADIALLVFVHAVLGAASCPPPSGPPPRIPGTVYGWGGTNVGQINTACVSNVVAIAAGYSHSLLLKSDGTVFACGAYSDFVGADPVVVPDGLSNSIAVA